jgi:Family of unknown function (DUF6056)
MSPRADTQSSGWQRVVCRLGPLLCFTPYAILAFFAQPSADDFCYTVAVRHMGFLGAQRWYYFNWTGRYAATALLTLSERIGAIERTYWIYIAGMLALTGAAVRFLLSRLCRAMGRPTDGSFLTSLALALLVLIMSRVSNPDESFYWLPGAFTYQLGVVCVVVTTGLLLSLIHKPVVSKVEAALLGVFGIVAVGLAEQFIPVMLFIYGLFAVAAFDQRSRSRWLILGLLAIAALGGLISVLAPGNLVRATSEGVSAHLPATVALTVVLKWSLPLLLRWLADVGVLAASLAVVLVLGDRHQEPIPFLPFFHRWHPIVRVASLVGLVGAVVCLSALPIVYALRTAPLQHRMINTAFMLFLYAWLGALLIGANEFLRWRAIDRPTVWAVAIGVLLVSVVGSTNFRESLRELRALPQFHREMQDRQVALAKAAASDHVVLEPITAPHRFLFHRDVSSTDVSEYTNTCYAAYLGVASVKLKTLPENGTDP